jgi:polyisoprenoid-binding protein YceI
MNRFLAVLAISLGALAFTTAARADDLKSDPVHSFVVFDVHHFSAGYVYGMFNGPTGAVGFDTGDLSKTTFDLSVDVDSIDTRNANRDKDLKGPDYFDAKQFPAMTFKSTSVSKTGDTTLSVTGDLTLHGVTKSITVPMEFTGAGKGMKGESRYGFRTTFKINRADYGVSSAPDAMIGQEVEITVAIEAVSQ